MMQPDDAQIEKLAVAYLQNSGTADFRNILRHVEASTKRTNVKSALNRVLYASERCVKVQESPPRWSLKPAGDPVTSLSRNVLTVMETLERATVQQICQELNHQQIRAKKAAVDTELTALLDSGHLKVLTAEQGNPVYALVTRPDRTGAGAMADLVDRVAGGLAVSTPAPVRDQSFGFTDEWADSMPGNSPELSACPTVFYFTNTDAPVGVRKVETSPGHLDTDLVWVVSALAEKLQNPRSTRFVFSGSFSERVVERLKTLAARRGILSVCETGRRTEPLLDVADLPTFETF